MITKEQLPVAGVSGLTGIAATVAFYLLTQNIFVTPSGLEASEQKILRQVAERYVTATTFSAYQADTKQEFDKLNEKMDMLLYRVDKNYRPYNHQ